MKGLASALSRMQATAIAPFGDRLDRPVDVEFELAELIETAEQLAASGTRKRKFSSATIVLAKARWAVSQGSLEGLTKRQVRALCADVEISVSRSFVAALALSKEFPGQRRWIESVIANYFNAWRPVDPEALESLLQGGVRGFKGKSTRISQCRPVANELFSSQSAAWLGEQIVRKRQAWVLVLQEWGVERSGRLAEATVNASVDAWLKVFANAGGTWNSFKSQSELRFVLETLLEPQVVTSAQFGRAISQVVLWPALDRDEELVELVRAYVLKNPRLGDPRHRPGNWSLCDPAAVRKARAWFARYDLEFFFKFVIRDDPHQRKRFWLDYIDKVEMSNVALCETDVQRLRASTAQRPRYSRAVGGGNVSAFLMKFPGSSAIFVEFSQPGNALYWHDGARFEQHVKGGITQPYLDISDELKSKLTMRDRISHFGGWQAKVRNVLATLGIHP